MKNNWPVKKLGEVTDVFSGVWGPQDNAGTAVLRSTNFNNDGTIAWNEVAYRSIPENKVNQLALNQGDILVEKSGGSPAQPVGRVVYFDAEQQGKVVFGNFISKLQVNDKEIEPKFLFYYLLYFYKTGGINRYQSQTTGIRNLQLKDYLGIEIPKFRTEVQKKIVERLDVIRKAQELCDQQIQKTEELFKSLLNEEFESSISWESKKIKDVSIDVVTGKTPSTSKKDFFIPEVNFATPADFDGSDLWIRETKRKISKKAIEEKAARTVPENSLMIVCIGATIGKIALSKTEISTNQQINSVIFNTKLIIPEFALLYFIRDKKLITKQAKQTTLPILNKTLTEELEIRIPDLGMQQKIVEKLEAVQNYKKLLQKEKALLKELFDSALDKSMNPRRPPAGGL